MIPDPAPAPSPPGSVPTRRLVLRLLLVVAAAFAFGWAMVPFYDVLCKVTGLNGKTNSFQAGGLAGAAEAPSSIDRTRTVTVEFTGTVMPGLPWDMRPLTASLNLHPGELQQVRYLVRNTSDRTIVGQAIPSVTPGQAAQHFQKLDCFCFREQSLAPFEAREMALTFIIKPEVDKDVRHITLSYAFYNTKEPSREAR